MSIDFDLSYPHQWNTVTYQHCPMSYHDDKRITVTSQPSKLFPSKKLLSASDDTTQNWPNCPTELRDRVQYEVYDVYEYLSIQEPGIIHQIPLKIEPLPFYLRTFRVFVLGYFSKTWPPKTSQMCTLSFYPRYPSPVIFRMEHVPDVQAFPLSVGTPQAFQLTLSERSNVDIAFWQAAAKRFADEAHTGPHPYHPCMVYVVPGDWVVPNHQPVGFLPSTINQPWSWFLW